MIEELTQVVRQTAEGKDHLKKDEHFAFAAGQVIARIFMQSEGSNRTYKAVEPYFRCTELGKFRELIQENFLRYSHKGYARQFENVCSEVLSCKVDKDLKTLRPLILAGIFYRETAQVGEKFFRITLLHAQKETVELEPAEAVDETSEN